MPSPSRYISQGRGAIWKNWTWERDRDEEIKEEIKRLSLMGMPSGNIIPSGGTGGLKTILLRHQTAASSIIPDG